MSVSIWQFIEVTDRIVHFVPVGDLVEHEMSHCVCGTTRELVDFGHGLTGLIVTHYSLDGREKHE